MVGNQTAKFVSKSEKSGMTRRITTRQQAAIDIDECFVFIAQNNENKAMKFFDSVRQSFAALARMPEMGGLYLHPSMPNSDLRKWPVKGFRGYLIFYRIHETMIEIVRVLPASRDLDRILESDLN
jgi:toxin ParE1/3/4